MELEIWIETLNDHVTPLYYGMVRDFLDNTSDPEVEEGHKPRKPKTFCVVFTHPNLKFDFEHVFDVNAAFKLSDQKKQHLATSYADLLGVKIGDRKENLKPIYIPIELKEDRNDRQQDEWYEIENLKGCILVSMFSASCTSHDPKYNYVPNKMLPPEKWIPMLKFLRKRFPETIIKVLGAPDDKLPNIFFQQEIYGVEAMFGIPLNRLALIMQKAKLLVTIDNGMAHLGATQEVPTFEMYPVALGPHYILPIGNPNLVWVQMNPVTIDESYLEHGLEYTVDKFERTIWRKK